MLRPPRSHALTLAGAVVVSLLPSFPRVACSLRPARHVPLQFTYDWFVPEDSGVAAAMRVRNEHFGGMYLPSSLYTKEANYSAQRAAFQNMTRALQVVPGVALYGMS